MKSYIVRVYVESAAADQPRVISIAGLKETDHSGASFFFRGGRYD
jgi:hypothetical protein